MLSQNTRGAEMSANVAVAQDPAGNLKPAKDKSTERIWSPPCRTAMCGRPLRCKENLQQV
jgi:hypothetical protein